MPFSKKTKDKVVVASRCACNVCGEWAGGPGNVHHIVQQADEKNDRFDNAILLCLMCHSWVGKNYCDRHPLGLKLTEEVLRECREQHYEWVRRYPYARLDKFPVVADPAGLLPLGHYREDGSHMSVPHDLYFRNQSNAPYYAIQPSIVFEQLNCSMSDIEIEVVQRPSATFVRIGDEKNRVQMILRSRERRDYALLGKGAGVEASTRTGAPRSSASLATRDWTN